MRLDSLFPFIVPLTFLAIWALTSLLNRDARPLPPRPGRGGPGGLDPRSPGLRDSSAAGRAAARDWGGSPAQARAVSRDRPTPPMGLTRRPGGDEGVVFPGDADQARRSAGRGDSQAQSRAARTAKAARGAKGRPVARTPDRLQDAPRALSDLINQSMAETKARPLEITPLASPLTPLMIPLSRASSTLAAEKGAERPQGVSIELIRAALAAPERLRELAVLSEILQPPLALRSSRRVR